MYKNTHQHGNLNRGFTIVELLIVIVVIGILAAITIVAFNGVQNRANDAAVKSDLKNFASLMEVFRATSTTSIYPAWGDLTTSSLPFKPSKNAYAAASGSNNFTICIENGSTPNFAVVARSKSNKVFYVSSATGQGEISTWSTTAGDNCSHASVAVPAAGTAPQEYRRWGVSPAPANTWLWNT